jgi:hypothetical protein
MKQILTWTEFKLKASPSEIPGMRPEFFQEFGSSAYHEGMAYVGDGEWVKVYVTEGKSTKASNKTFDII